MWCVLSVLQVCFDWFSRSRTLREWGSVPDPMKAKTVFFSLAASAKTSVLHACQWMGESAWLWSRLLSAVASVLVWRIGMWMPSSRGCSSLADDSSADWGRQELTTPSINNEMMAMILLRGALVGR